MEKTVDGQVEPASFVTGQERENACVTPKVSVRWDHVDAIGLDAHSVRRFDDRERAHFGEKRCEQAWLRGLEVLDHHEGHADIVRKPLNEASKRAQASCRCAEHDDREWIARRVP